MKATRARRAVLKEIMANEDFQHTQGRGEVTTAVDRQARMASPEGCSYTDPLC